MGLRLKTNAIRAYDDAVVHHSMKGDQFEGVWAGGIYSGCDITTNVTDKTVTVASGYGSIAGRQFQIVNSYGFSLSALTGIKYCIIYAEINLKNVTNPTANLKLIYAGAGFPDLESDDLINNLTGIARMPLYSFVYNAEGPTFGAVNALRYEYEKGTAENVRQLDPGAKLNGREITALIHYNADRWKHAEHAIYSDATIKVGKTTDGAHVINANLIMPNFGNSGVVQISNGVFRIVGQKHVTEPEDAMVLDENQTYRFYYQGNRNSKLPRNLKVVGVIVQGLLQISRWKWEAILPRNRVWQAYSPAIQHMGNKQILGEYDRDEQVDDRNSIWGADVWNARPYQVTKRQGSILYLGRFSTKRQQGGGYVIDLLGNMLSKDRYDIDTEVETFIAAEIQFINTQSALDPYLEVRVRDNFRIAGDMTFRLIFIDGEISADKEEINPFAGLNPPLV